MADSPSSKLEIPLPPSVESMIETICREQSQPSPGSAARKELQALGEEESLEILNVIRQSTISKSFHGFVLYLVRERKSRSPLRSSVKVASPQPLPQPQPLLQGIADWRAPSPQFLALEGLEFRRLFLILSYIGRKKLEDVVSVDEIQSIRAQGEHLSMGAYESLIWNKLGQREKADRLKYRNWDPSRKTYYYHCHVYSDGNYTFKGPYLNTTSTLLQRVLKDENVLIVKFAEEETKSSIAMAPSNLLYSRFRKVAEEGILLGWRCYRFFAFKDGGKEGKKKDPTSSSVKCYFVNMESLAQFFRRSPSEKIHVHEARCIFMHVHTVSSLSAYMARFSLILSKTIKLEVELDDAVSVQDIDDIACKYEDGSFVYGEDGKLLIQTDGTGFISEDLALRCPRNCYKGSFPNDANFQRYLDVIKLLDKSLEHSLKCRRSEPFFQPLLIQFRMFHNGRAVKGTVLVNKQLPEKTIQIRPSMIKVNSDSNLFGAPTVNSFEIVSTSNRPKKPHFSRFLIALLHFGGVPRQFFTDILDEAVADTENVLSNMRGALRVALIHGDMDDDFTVARMLLSGIPLEESYIQWRLPVLAKELKKSLKEGKLPIKDSFYLMGTADPIDCLDKNEVCIIHENGQISGDVLVYRNPGIHFGDIRKLRATHQKALEDIVGNSKYGIFFSTRGTRSMADQMAGGDYDGDMYWVSRNTELLRYFIPSEPWTCSSSLTNAKATKKPTEFSADDLEHELFHLFLDTRFKPSKSTGMAADSWLSYMDRMLTLGYECVDERNLLKEKMLRLVNIYYDALDAPKKGVKVELPPEFVPEKYPHYMGRGEMFCYRSKSILGEIYDKADELTLEDSSLEVWKLPNFDVEIPSARLQLWDDHYKIYRSEMAMALQSAAESKQAAGDVILKYKQVLYGADDFDKSNRSWEEIRLDALAVYHVTYDYAINTGQAKYCGFAWRVAGPALLKAFIDEQDEKPAPCLLSVLRQLLI